MSQTNEQNNRDQTIWGISTHQNSRRTVRGHLMMKGSANRSKGGQHKETNEPVSIGLYRQRPLALTLAFCRARSISRAIIISTTSDPAPDGCLSRAECSDE